MRFHNYISFPKRAFSEFEMQDVSKCFAVIVQNLSKSISCAFTISLMRVFT